MNQNTNLTIIRHGETEWNKLGKCQGHLDSSLTEAGLFQARIANALNQTGFDTLIPAIWDDHSKLQR